MDRVFFAGEHTCQQFVASVHGAYISGVREAIKIEALQKPPAEEGGGGGANEDKVAEGLVMPAGTTCVLCGESEEKDSIQVR